PGVHGSQTLGPRGRLLLRRAALSRRNGVRLKVRSLVGLLPLAATTVLPGDLRERLPRFFEEAQWFLERHPHTAAVLTVPLEVGAGGNRILSLVNPDKLRRILGYMLNENEF